MHVEPQFLAERRFLKERVLVVPGSELEGRRAVPFRELAIDLFLRLAERPVGAPLKLVEYRQQLDLVDLGQLELHGVVVAIAERARRLVPSPDQLAQPIGNPRRDLLRGFPRRLAARLVPLGPQQLEDLVVGDCTTLEIRAKGVELRLDRLAAANQVVDHGLGQLIGPVVERQELELTAEHRVAKRRLVQQLHDPGVSILVAEVLA